MSLTVNDGGVEFRVAETYTLNDIHRVQRRSLQMFREIAEVLDRNEIAYTLGYGSLLGQVRHGGFIPWDDDIDLFILSTDYARAILCLRRELPSDMLLHNMRNDRIYWVTWVKVRDLHSDAVELMWKIDRKLHFHGIAIDLIRVEPMTSGQYYRTPRIQALKAKRARVRAQFRERMVNRVAVSYLGTTLSECYFSTVIFYHRFRRIIGRRKLVVAAPRTVIEKTFKFRHMFPLSAKPGVFEGIAVPTPRKPKRVLRAIYGAFDELPPVEDRQAHFESIEFFDNPDSKKREYHSNRV